MENKLNQSRPKVLYVLSGIPHYTAPLLERIVAKGFQLVMLIPETRDNLVLGHGVKLVDDSHSFVTRYSRIEKAKYNKSRLADLKSTIEEEKPNILIIGWPYFLQLFFERNILKVLKKNNTKLILREIPFQTPPFGKLLYYKRNPVYNENLELQSTGMTFYLRVLLTMLIRRFLYRKADATLNYASCAFDILPSYGIPKTSIFVSYNTSDTTALMEQRELVESTPMMLPPRQRIVHIGRLVKWKKVDLLLSAFELVLKNYPNSELLVIGEGPEKNALKEMAVAAGIEAQVQFVGSVYDPYLLGKYMYESTVYVLAGMGGLSINDAMCFSLPVICSVCDGTEKDLIEDKISGYFFREDDVEDLKQKIELILSNDVKAKQMGEAAYNVIKEKINLETVSDRYIDAFKYVLNN